MDTEVDEDEEDRLPKERGERDPSMVRASDPSLIPLWRERGGSLSGEKLGRGRLAVEVFIDSVVVIVVFFWGSLGGGSPPLVSPTIVDIRGEMYWISKEGRGW
jgi:hypothetical protein